VKISVKPERREEFLTCIAANQKGTLSTESKVLAYLFGEDVNIPNKFHFFERYDDENGFKQHTQTAHFKAWEAFAATDPFTAPVEVIFYETIGNDSIPKRRKMLRFFSRVWRGTKGAVGGTFRSFFMFFEQFDPNPVTEEGKARKERLANGESEEISNEQIMGNFTGL
jgi:quinol monooxygenase YgiN